MSENIISVKDLIVQYDDFVLFDNLNFEVKQKDIFFIMCASGCGKSSLLKVLTGLIRPNRGEVLIDGYNFSGADYEKKKEIMKNCGVMYQSGALFSSMSLYRICLQGFGQGRAGASTRQQGCGVGG